jgi:hypothetical protein
MNATNDNQLHAPIQVLVPTCATTDAKGMRLGWLHSYCLLSLRPAGGTLTIDGEVRIGDRYRENHQLTQDLADALEPHAALAGNDLTAIIDQLSRLPIEATDQTPALNLLAKLKAMLLRQTPFDLALSEHSRDEIAVQAGRHGFIIADGPVDEHGKAKFGAQADIGSGHPNRQAIDLADTAGLYLLAIGSVYLAANLQPKLFAAWQKWRRTFTAQLPLQEDDGVAIVIF